MITQTHPKFFKPLSGSNAQLYEGVLTILYDEIFRGTMGQSTINKAYVRQIVLREMRTHNWSSDEDGVEICDIQSRAAQVVNRLVDDGWLEAKYDHMEMDNIFNFSRTGRKIAQTMHQIDSKHLATRHRNVRSTLKSLQSFLEHLDPYDLVDAEESSDYIVSDLMDQINEIHESRKQIVKMAMKSIQEAGEGFFDSNKSLISEISVSFIEDSPTKYSSKIQAVIEMIIEDEGHVKRGNIIMKERYNEPFFQDQ